MKQRLFIFSAFFILIATLIGLNAASYTQTDSLPDSEEFPNRSTFNPGSTGTRALYELLEETGTKVTRWQENPASLLGAKRKPDTFVIIGNLRRELSGKESEQILNWVSEGGKLVVIDRSPDKNLLSTTANWVISTTNSKEPVFGVNPSDQLQMTEKTVAAKALQPTVFTRAVNAVQPSRFASGIKLDYFGEDEKPETTASPEESSFSLELQGRARPVEDEPLQNDEPPATAQPAEIKGEKDSVDSADLGLNAPFLHFANREKAILADFPYGAGQIVFLSDPYIVSNAGIGIVDNAQLAVNIIAAPDTLVAFDEYHHGYGAAENRLFQYFAGTPVLWILAQIILLIVLALWSQSRRFARPLPANEPNRLSKLEYVSAFAELQQRTKAYDLALENIYSEFRRSTTRLFGMDNFTASRKDLAKMIAERGKFNEMKIYNLMKECEEIIHGEPTSRKEILQLTARLREIQNVLGIKRTSRTR